MTFQEAVAHFHNSRRKMAYALDISIQAVQNWAKNPEKPIRFLFIASAKEELMISPKIHIDCSLNSSLTFIEHQVGYSDNFFMNSSINCFLDENSSLLQLTFS